LNFSGFDVGLSPSCTISYRTCITSNGTISVPTLVGREKNSYAIQHGTDHCYLSGVEHQFELPREAIKPCWQDSGNVIGCGILLLRQQSKDVKISIFFTLNGHLIGECSSLMLFGIFVMIFKFRQSNSNHALGRSTLSYCQHMEFVICDQLW
jgi:hypothetical protein